MKLPPMLEKNRKSLSYLGGALFIWFAFVYGVKPYRAALTGAHASYDREYAMLLKERDAVETAKLNPKLQQMTDSSLKAVEPKLFEGREDGFVTSDLASYLADVALQNKVSLINSVTRPATSSTPGVRTLHVDIRAESDFQGILSFLKSLEQGDKLVEIERLNLTRTQKGTGTVGTPEDFETISIAATISGYAMGELTTVTTSKLGAKAPTTAGAPPGANLPGSKP